jgi:hypothetical protein
LAFNRVVGRSWPEIAALTLSQAKHVGARLIVVDTLSHFAGMEEDEENSAGAALTAMKPLLEAAGEGIAVITVRHERKSGGDLSDAGRGSSAFGGAVDTQLALRRVPGQHGTARKIEAQSRFDSIPTEAVYDYVNGEYVFMGTESSICEVQAERVILQNAPQSEEDAKTLDELIADSNIKRTVAYEVLKTMHREGKLVRLGRGKKRDAFRYFLPKEVSSESSHIGADESRRMAN